MKIKFVFLFLLIGSLQHSISAQTIRVAQLKDGAPTMLLDDSGLTASLKKVLKGDDVVIGAVVKATDKLGEFYYVQASVNRAGVGSMAAIILKTETNGDLTYTIGGDECIMECVKTQPGRGGQIDIIERCKTQNVTGGTAQISF